MRNLINMSLYAFNKSYDYQSVCDPEEEPKQGAGLRSAYVVSSPMCSGWHFIKSLQVFIRIK